MRFKHLRKTAPFLLGGYIFLNPFPYSTSIREILFYLSLCATLVLIIFGREPLTFRTPLTRPFILFLVWSILGIPLSLDPINSANDILFHLIKHLALFYMLIHFFSGRQGLSRLAYIMLASGTVLAVVILIRSWDAVLANPLQRGGLDYTDPPLGVMTLALALSCLLALHKLKTGQSMGFKMILIAGLLLKFTMMFFLQTRSIILAIVAGFMILFYDKKIIIGILMIGVLLGVLLTPLKGRFSASQNYTDRITIAWYTIEVIKDHPLTGIGYGQSIFGNNDIVAQEVYWARMPKRWRHKADITDPHNMFLSVTVRLGIVGLGFYFYLLAVCFLLVWRLIRKTAEEEARQWGFCLLSILVMFIVNGQFHVVYADQNEVMMFAIFAMLIISQRIWPAHQNDDLRSIHGRMHTDNEHKRSENKQTALSSG